MNDSARIYRATILLAIYGPRWTLDKVDDLCRLNQIAEHLAECEEAQRILRANGHGRAGMSFVELACSIPQNVGGVLARIFKRTPAPKPEALHDIWTAR